MCGITGFFIDPAVDKSFVPDVCLQAMNEALVHRGPDDSGYWFDKGSGLGLAHRRLSIIDTSRAGQQPMLSSSGRFRVVFNGEIYNHVEIRKEIEAAKDINWRSTSDTETLLESVELWGLEASVAKFVGMFAIALWDQEEKTLSLIRDRMGEKPLYYGWQNNVFMFGSELKSLYAHPSFEHKLSKKSISLFMRYSYVPDPNSIFENIYKLPPSSILKISLGSKDQAQESLLKPSLYWSLKDAFLKGKQDLILDPNEAVKGLQETLLEATRIQSRADVPLGAFLSGGIDSSTVVALLQEQSSKPIKTYTIGFENQEYDEAGVASKIASILGTDHTEHYVNASEALDVIPKLAHLYDEPFADSSQIPTFIVSRLAATEVNVALSGDAGDELFGGYNRYISAPLIYRNFKFLPYSIRLILAKSFSSLPMPIWQVLGNIFSVKQAPDKIKKVFSILQSKDLDMVYARLTSHWLDQDDLVFGANFSYSLDSEWMNEGTTFEAEEKMMYQDLTSYLLGDILVKLDRASMGVSLETRVPMLDYRVVEYSCRLPLNVKIRDGSGKWPLRKILENYIPKDLIDKPKMGFGVPIHEWLRGSLRDWAESLLDESRLRNQGIFNVRLVRKRWSDHLARKGNYQHELWNVLMFQSWYDSYQSNIKSKIIVK
jgi:asparagine synthase (glutamine-hydrolysing)